MLIRISNFINSDTILDIPAHLTHGNIITAGRNYTLNSGKIGARRGAKELYGTPAVMPYWVVPNFLKTTPYWLYAGLSKIYLLYDGEHTNVTRQSAGVDVDYTATEATPWTGGAWNGLTLLNNSNDIPQVFSSLTGKCTDMANWPSTLRCASLRPFKNILIAANVTENGVNYPQVLRWSHPADPGAEPGVGAWDYTDATKDAGRVAIPDTKGYLIDTLAGQDVHMVYKNDSVYYMQYVGAPFIFNIQRVYGVGGILSANCAVNVPGGQVVLGSDDVMFVTPRGGESIVKDRIRKTMFSRLNFDKRHFAFVAANTVLSEVWICIPEDSTYANKAYIWNYQSNKWSVRDLPQLTSLAVGYDVPGYASWADDPASWDSDLSSWGAYDITGGQWLGTSRSDNGHLVVFEDGVTEFGSNVAVQVEHHSIDTFAELQVSPDRMKLIRSIRPHFSPESAGAVVTFEIGVRNWLDGEINWSPPVVFTVGSSKTLYVRKQGRYLSWRITSQTNVVWELEGMDVEVEVGGAF